MAATDKNMTFDVNLLPTTTGDHNLGSSELKWKINGVADPKLTDSDTKNTAGSTNSSSKLYLIGATSQAANPTTNSYQYTYTNNGLLSALKVGLNLDGTEKAHLEWNNTDQSIDFIFD